ncbi:hypothetical protein F5Y13DRAFT_156403 [Hypoxylon sp. FL1857]|nr:hypothetical protein F5Y13DRAFT_156403 [Hypoxylon sp. FL1857]
MSSESQPIDALRFAAAIKELPAESLALKVLEIRNAIAHLDYSIAELRPFAEGRPPLLNEGETEEPDQDCIDAIVENEAVIARMQNRIELIRAEVERRGLSWREFQGKPDDEKEEEASGATDSANAGSSNTTNGVNGHGAVGEGQHPAWRDGTFQTGTINQLGDEERELLRQLQSRMPPEDDEDPEGGVHL